jgi:hypothetical protein
MTKAAASAAKAPAKESIKEDKSEKSESKPVDEPAKEQSPGLKSSRQIAVPGTPSTNTQEAADSDNEPKLDKGPNTSELDSDGLFGELTAKLHEELEDGVHKSQVIIALEAVQRRAAELNSERKAKESLGEALA